ncbi:MAG: hypothetical protein GY928_03125 [Colwellia sp.]|nr:hypothetical protein [Colwellia sp.]
MDNQMYGVLCESDTGLDAFGNPKGKPILFESIGDMSKGQAIDHASKIQAHGKYGKVKIVRLEVLNVMIDGVA